MFRDKIPNDDDMRSFVHVLTGKFSWLILLATAGAVGYGIYILI